MLDKVAELEQRLVAWGRVAIGFSGGVDSTLLLYLALKALGSDRVLAITVDTPLMPRSELESARELAVAMGATTVELAPELLSNRSVTENLAERCYHCKIMIFSEVQRVAAERGFAVVVDGSNLDDASDFRPGSRALVELGIRSPLQEVGLSKEEIRKLSRYYELETADKPSMACLASRVPYGTALSLAVLKKIEGAEEVVKQAGFSEYRVRHHDDTARVELPDGDIGRVVEPAVRERVVEGIRRLGYRYVVLDLEGYRMGRLNEELSVKERESGGG